jgi:membrane protein implicated in regulation of membrane protease activity
MSARMLQFPAPGRRIVRVERDRDGGEWLVIHDGNAWPCSSRAEALREAVELAAQYGAALVAEAAS